MMMPVMDGAQTCRAIREDPQLRDTMVVFLSALGEEEQQLAGFRRGADDHLTKPIKMKLLVSRVQAILKRIDAGKAPAPAEEGVAMDRERYTVTRDGREISLPRKEFALLDLLYCRRANSSRAKRYMPGSGVRRWSWATAPSTYTSASCARRSATKRSSPSRAWATNTNRNAGRRPDRKDMDRTSKYRRIVIKAGSNVLTRDDGRP